MPSGPLTWFEVRRVTAHPLIGLSVLGTALIGVYTYPEVGSEPFWYFALTMQPTFLLGPAALLAANRAATRERRADTVDVLDGVPLTLRTRTCAVLIAAVGPALLCAALIALGAVARQHLAAVGDRPPTVAELALPPVTVLSAGLLGVMVARWLPYPAAVTIVLIALVGWVMVTTEEPPWSPWLGPYGQFFVYEPGLRHVAEYYPGRPAWHAVYLLGLGVLAAVCALLATPGPRRALIVTGTVAACAAGLAGWWQLP
jgi:hypothetical protein